MQGLLHQYTQLVVGAVLGQRDFALGGEVLGEVDEQRLRLVDVAAAATGPIAAMSSSSILPAREDMLPRKKPLTSSLALFQRDPSLSLSIWRIGVARRPRSSLIQVVEGEHQGLDGYARPISRFSSSSEVMKRVSV